MLYKTSNRDLVYKEIKKLKPLNYNQFRWWRRFDTKTKPLSKGATFLQRIQNGECEFSHYFWQWKLTEIELNDLYKKYNGKYQLVTAYADLFGTTYDYFRSFELDSTTGKLTENTITQLGEFKEVGFPKSPFFCEDVS